MWPFSEVMPLHSFINVISDHFQLPLENKIIENFNL